MKINCKVRGKVLYSSDLGTRCVKQIFKERDQYGILINDVLMHTPKGKSLFTLDELAEMVIMLEETITFGNIGNHHLGKFLLDSKLLEDYKFINISHQLSQDCKRNGMVKYRYEVVK